MHSPTHRNRGVEINWRRRANNTHSLVCDFKLNGSYLFQSYFSLLVYYCTSAASPLPVLVPDPGEAPRQHWMNSREILLCSPQKSLSSPHRPIVGGNISTEFGCNNTLGTRTAAGVYNKVKMSQSRRTVARLVCRLRGQRKGRDSWLPQRNIITAGDDGGSREGRKEGNYRCSREVEKNRGNQETA